MPKVIFCKNFVTNKLLLSYILNLNALYLNDFLLCTIVFFSRLLVKWFTFCAWKKFSFCLTGCSKRTNWECWIRHGIFFRITTRKKWRKWKSFQILQRNVQRYLIRTGKAGWKLGNCSSRSIQIIKALLSFWSANSILALDSNFLIPYQMFWVDMSRVDLIH